MQLEWWPIVLALLRIPFGIPGQARTRAWREPRPSGVNDGMRHLKQLRRPPFSDTDRGAALSVSPAVWRRKQQFWPSDTDKTDEPSVSLKGEVILDSARQDPLYLAAALAGDNLTAVPSLFTESFPDQTCLTVEFAPFYRSRCSISLAGARPRQGRRSATRSSQMAETCFAAPPAKEPGNSISTVSS